MRDWTSIDPQRWWRDDEETIIRVDETEWVLGVESSSGRRVCARWKCPRWFAANIVSTPCGESS